MDGIVNAEGGNANANINATNNCIPSSHKLLRAPIPNELVFGFIHKIAHKPLNSNYYLIDVCAYKKSVYCDAEAEADADADADAEAKPKPSLLQQFCNDLMPYYCKDKQFFITRKMSYNNLNTILRQICRHCAIECKSERKYDKSKTQIVYHIYEDGGACAP